LLFVDTAGWLAAFSATEAAHEEVKAVIAEARVARKAILTSDYVLDELLTLVQRRFGHADARRIGEMLWRRRGAEIIDVDAAARENAWSIFQKYSEHGLSFTDCTSAALMRLRGIDDILTLDKHFDLFGFNRLPE
jgi:predicted nucleic acid-binding protein